MEARARDLCRVLLLFSRKGKRQPPTKEVRDAPKTQSTKTVSKSSSSSELNPTSPNNATLINAFSKLDISGRKNSKELRQSKRNYSTESNSKTPNAPYSDLKDIAKLISSGRARNIIVMAGAGISTASGIPDFRTPGTGLYDNLKQYKIPSPTAIFDLDYFHYDPKPFFTLAKELYPSGKYRPCLPHYFVRLLHEKNLLLRMYTQNIDGLERIAGIPPEKLVEAHGTFTSASCTRCGKKYNGGEIKKKILNGKIPRCQSTELCWGIVKPDIVFFGEDLPRRFYYYLKDFPACDLLIIMGTSLEVEPFASLTDSVRAGTPRLLLNWEIVGPFARKSVRKHDLAVTGDLTESIERFAGLMGWKDDLSDLMVAESQEEDVEEKDAKSDTTSTDSGHSSPSSTGTPVKPTAKKSDTLLPPNNNIKRYFHTLRSTPMPNSKRLMGRLSEPVPGQTSYFEYIRGKPSDIKTQSDDRDIVKNIRRKVFSGTGHSDSQYTIQYAQTVRKKKTVVKAPATFGAGKFSNQQRKLSTSSDSSDASQSDTSGQDSSYISSSSDGTSV